MRFKNTVLPLILLIGAVFLSGCGFRNITVIYVPKDADAFARDYLNMLKKGDIDGAMSATNKDLLTDKAKEQFLEISRVLDKGELLSAEVVKFYNMKWYFSKEKKTLIDYQLQLEGAWVEAIVVVEGGDGAMSVSGVYVEPLPKSLREIHSENFYAKPPQQYMVAFIAFIIPIFIFYTLILCFFMPVRFKAVWAILIVVGIARLSLDWTTGQIAFYPFSLMFFGAEAVKDGIYGPWVLSVSFPLGAVAFHAYNKMMRAGGSSVRSGAEVPKEGA